MMKLIVLSAVLAVTFADVSHLKVKSLGGGFGGGFVGTPVHSPVPVARVAASSVSGPQVAILRSSSDITPEGSYQYAYETENGISAQEQGSVKVLGPEEASKSAQGTFQWTSPEGVPVAIQYVADENGYQPQGDAIPTAPPTPVHILKALEWIAAHPQPAEGEVRVGVNRRF